ncbi:OVARIAN TUMOR DOMAIN-containing deubiquitinating enzyme 7 isoform X6 [Mangifera indica]|uniref:OVARIAN TUMOR DOMAIN-containing deubiquitinating enzyme 7 isoform X6 n=1 Tax=Mangifera indica TaxID=29780 RepID=UPI001CFA9FFE|nr:OVARIAN TUMOR DOMAIN-containing deubiquitinating enzyme 7 isoform X6 [Mangifera indica]
MYEFLETSAETTGQVNTHMNCLCSEKEVQNLYDSSSHRRIVKHLSPLLRMMSPLMSIANPWMKMAHGPDIWNYRQPLSLHIVIYAFTGSYHDGEHYNSVRLKEDPCNGSARPIKIKVDADLSAASHQAKTAANKSEGGTVPTVINAGSIKVVMAGTGCENAERVEQALLEVGGDTDAAIEFLIAEQGGDNYPVENNLLPCHADISHGDNENGNSKQLEVEPVKKTCEQDLSSNSLKRAHEDVRSQPDDKKIPRNKVCPCGSKKKYKACCGSATGRSTKFVVNQTTDFRKSRKERKQGKSGGPSKSTSSIGSDGGPPDMGALCI